MIKRTRNILLSIIMCFLLATITSFVWITPSKIDDAYALGTENLISKQSSMVNNVVLFAFQNNESRVRTSTGYTQDTLDFISNFDNFINNNSNSLKAYYYAMSNGKFSINSNLVMNNNNTPNDTSDDYPFVAFLQNKNMSDFSNDEALINAIMQEVNKHSTTIILDSSADCNNDSIIDNLSFVSLEFPKSGDPDYEQRYTKYKNTILWPHVKTVGSPWSFQNGGKTYKCNKNLIMPSYYFNVDENESNVDYLNSAIIHEFGHVLGLPDLYVVDAPSNSYDRYVGLWDIMSSNRMQSMNEYFKNKLGWTNNLTFKEIKAKGDYKLIPSNTNEIKIKQDLTINNITPTAYYIKDPDYSNQYIVIEYKNLDNEYGYDNNIKNLRYTEPTTGQTPMQSGLVVYRVNENYTSDLMLMDSNKVNEAVIYYFRKDDSSYVNSNVGCASLRSGSFGSSDEGLEQSNINTQYISFESSVGGTTKYVNSKLVITINSINDSEIDFNISGGALADPYEEPPIRLSDLLADQNLFLAFAGLFQNINPNDLTINDLESLKNTTVLNFSNKGITDLTGLSNIYLPNLTTLILNSNNITNGLQEISALTQLTNLQMSNCGLTDISFIEPLVNLKYVNLSVNNIENFNALDPTSKTQLEVVNLVLNNFDPSLQGNTFLVSNIYNYFVLGIQNYPKHLATAIVEQTFYYYPQNMLATITLALSSNNVSITLNEGKNTLINGNYNLTYIFDYAPTFIQNNISFSISVYVVSLKKPIVELLQNGGISYTEITSQNAGNHFNGWNQNYTLFKEITFENDVVSAVDIGLAGEYEIKFIVGISDNIQFTLYQQVIIYSNNAIIKGTGGIVDEGLYELLLRLVDKGVDEMLYSQDLYFYDILEKGDPITELRFPNTTTKEGIKSLEGLQLLNLKKIELIDFNSNKLDSIAPLFEGGSESMPNLQYLNLANIGITSLPETIGEFYSLKKIDLSFNKLTRVDALKPIADYQLLMSEGRAQNLELVNLNMNFITFTYNSIPERNYQELNGFIKTTAKASGYRSGDEIFIIMIQNLSNYASYVNTVTFAYYETTANQFKRGNNIENIFSVSLNGATNSQKNWVTSSVSNSITAPGQHNLTFALNTTNPFTLQPSQFATKLKTVFYLSQVTLNSLRQINSERPSGYYILEDTWDIEQRSYTILSNERINAPKSNEEARNTDLSVTTSVPNPTFNCTSRSYTRYYNGAYYTDTPVDLTKDSAYTYGSRQTIYVEYVVSIYPTSDTQEYLFNTVPLTYSVAVIPNLELKIDDAELDAKMRSVLKKSETDKLYRYDTYNIKRLDLSNCNIESIRNTARTNTGNSDDIGDRDVRYSSFSGYNSGTFSTYGFTSFNFTNLTHLNLSKNKLTTFLIPEDSSSKTFTNFPNLQYLDISFNNLSDASELKVFSTNTTLYILAFMNNYIIGDADDPRYQNNNWLMNGKSGNRVVFSGIQGINSTEKYFVTYSKEVAGPIGSKAGFYFIDANFDLATGYKFTCDGAEHEIFEEDLTSHFNYYYYYTEPRQFSITLNFTYGEFNFKYQGTINHIKAYDGDTVYIVDYDRNNSQETIEEVLNYDCMIYENCSRDDFDVFYQIYKNGELLDNIYINELTDFDQTITLVHKKTGRLKIYKKIIYVKDREKPQISMADNSSVIKTTINIPYSYYSSGHVDRDIDVIDNYDPETDIVITAKIFDSEGNEIDQNYIPLNKPDTYTMNFYATDTSGNVSDTITRKVKVVYNDFETIKLTKPDSLLYVGEATFKCTVYRNDSTKDPNPTFNWYIDGKFYKSTKMDENLPNPNVVITSTLALPMDVAGKHLVTVRINENTDPDYDIVAQMSEIEYVVLVDNSVVNILIIIVASIIFVIIIIAIIIHFRRKKKNQDINKYEYSLISKK